MTADDMTTDEKRETRRGAFFGRRKGHKLRPSQARLMSEVLPALALDLSKPASDLRALFAVPVDRVRLEIGFGGGEHLLHEARQNPASGFIGCEPYQNGMARALAVIEAEGLKNIRLHYGDALGLIEWLPEASLSRIDILYPDPWPKRRHWKRRFISEQRAARLAKILAPGGELRFATDIASYAEWALLRLLRAPGLAWTAERADDWRLPWAGFPSTRYEAKALIVGRKPTYLRFQRA
jgi:tRNA (guanine-N7-)-methyltransferase